LSEETQDGQVSENPVPTGTETPATGGETERLVDADPRLNGKSAAELADIIRNQDKQLGKFGNEIGKVRDLETQIASLTEFVRQRETQVRQPEPQKQVLPTFDITDPDGSLNRIFDTKLQQYHAYQQQQAAARELTEAQANFAEGKEAFLSDPRYKHLYDGIEGEIEKSMVSAYRGKIFTKDQLRSPKSWVAAAKAIAIERDDTERLIRKQGMAANVVEKPGSARAGDEDEGDVDAILSDPGVREEMRIRNLSEKQAREWVKASLDASRRGLNR
jgi:hypothetical protein